MSPRPPSKVTYDFDPNNLAGGAGTMGGAAPVIAYSTAALLAVGYGILSVAISATVLVRRDVTS